MEGLKQFVTTLTTMIIFISAVELIAPKDATKKYISFILGLILISVMLNPIVDIITNGERNIIDSIDKYTAAFSSGNRSAKNMEDQDEIFFESNLDNNDSRNKAFIQNFNKNCEDMLRKKFEKMNFKCNVECDVDFNNINIDIKKLQVDIVDKKIKKIQEVRIGEDEMNKSKNDNSEYKEVIEFLSTELNIPKEKIEVHRVEE